MKQRSGDDGIGSGGLLLSGAREYRGPPADAVHTQFSASRKIACRPNQRFEGTHSETRDALPIFALYVSW
jgi:hypothetical protein